MSWLMTALAVRSRGLFSTGDQRSEGSLRSHQRNRLDVRGMAYWSAGGSNGQRDRPTDAKRLHSRANVIDGRFTYIQDRSKPGTRRPSCRGMSGQQLQTRHRGYRDDPALIDRYGSASIEVTAFATTSRGQARRMGRWISTARRTRQRRCRSQLVSIPQTCDKVT